MHGGVLTNWPIGLVFILIIVGGPLLLTFRRRHASPDYREARIHFAAKRHPGTAASTSDYAASERVVATDGLTIPSSPLADPDEQQEQRPGPGPSGNGTSPRSPRTS